MNAGRLLLTLFVLLAADTLLAEEVGEISDDFDPPPLMKSSSTTEGAVKSAIKQGVNVTKEKSKEEKKARNATGSVEKGEKSEGRIEGKKNPGLSGSTEKKEKESKNKITPSSGEKIVKDAPQGDKIVMVTPEKTDKKEKEGKNEKSESIVALSSEQTTKINETTKKASSTENKGSGEKKEEKELKKVDVKKPVEGVQETTQQETSTVVTTANLPLNEDSTEKKTEMVDGEGEVGSEEQEEREGEEEKSEEEKKEEKEEEKEKKEEEKKEEKRPYPRQPITTEYFSDSHFFSFFIFFVLISAVGYLAYHNKRKIMALLVEGRSSKGGRVRYHRLANDDNFERNVIY